MLSQWFKFKRSQINKCGNFNRVVLYSMGNIWWCGQRHQLLCTMDIHSCTNVDSWPDRVYHSVHDCYNIQVILCYFCKNHRAAKSHHIIILIHNQKKNREIIYYLPVIVLVWLCGIFSNGRSACDWIHWPKNNN